MNTKSTADVGTMANAQGVTDITPYLQYFDGFYSFIGWKQEMLPVAFYRKAKGDPHAVLIWYPSGGSQLLSSYLPAWSQSPDCEDPAWLPPDPSNVPSDNSCVMYCSVASDGLCTIIPTTTDGSGGLTNVNYQLCSWYAGGNSGKVAFARPGEFTNAGVPHCSQVIPSQDSGSFKQIDFRYAWLWGVTWDQFTLAHCDFSHVKMQSSSFAEAIFTNDNFSGNTISSCNFRGAIFTSNDCSGTTFHGCDLSSMKALVSTKFEATKFVNCNLSGVVFAAGNDFTQATFDGCKFDSLAIFSQPGVGTVFHGCDFTQCTMSGATWDGYDFTNCNFSGVSFAGASLRNVNFSGANLTGCDFTGARIDGANLAGADLSRANLLHVELPANAASTAKLATSTDARTKFCFTKIRTKLMPANDGTFAYNWSYCDLTGATLIDDNGNQELSLMLINFSHSIISTTDNPANWTGAATTNLSYSDLSYTLLQNINLAHAQLNNTNFTGANISNADLSYAIFYGAEAKIVGATVVDTNFSGAFLQGVDFSGIDSKNLQGCVFTGCCLVNATFAGTDLSRQEGQSGVSFDRACLQGVDFSGANLSGASLKYAAISAAPGSLQINGLANLHITQTNYGATQLEGVTTDSSTICPAGCTGPCSDPSTWQSPNAPQTWTYNG